MRFLFALAGVLALLWLPASIAVHVIVPTLGVGIIISGIFSGIVGLMLVALAIRETPLNPGR